MNPIWNLYDAADAGETRTEWFTFLDVDLGGQAEDSGHVYVWLQHGTDTDNKFDVDEYDGPGELEDAIDEWLADIGEQ